MAWMITTDHWYTEGGRVDGETNREGEGQWGREQDDNTVNREGAPSIGSLPFEFRIKDEDGHLYYSGRYDFEALNKSEDHGGLEQAWEFGIIDVGGDCLEVKAADYIAHRYKEGIIPERLVDHYQRSTDADGWYAPFG